jgi:hypothetical protein
MSRAYGDALADDVLSSKYLSQSKVFEIGFYQRVDNFNYPCWLQEDECDRFRGLSAFGRYARLWREMTTRAIQPSNILLGDRYLEIRYEDIVCDPVHEGLRIKSFLGNPSSSGIAKSLRGAFAASVGIASKNQDSRKLK